MDSTTDSGIMCNSSIVKSPSLSTISTLSRWRPKFLRHKRPLSLDLTYSSDEAYIKSSTDTLQDSIAEAFVSNELPLPPRCPKKRPLRGTKPPPRHLLGPKPARFLTKGNDDKNSDLTDVTDKDSVVYTDYKDSELYTDDKEVDEPQDIVSDVETEDETETIDYTNLEEIKQNGLLHVPTDPKLEATDLISESSTDTTVVTAIEVKVIHMNKHATVSRETSKSIVSTDSSYGTPVSSKSIFDYSKLTKDIHNKISKDTSQRLANNLATEISNFFKISASKLRPPCLHSRKDTAIEEVVVRRSPETEKNRRLIPRSPYIAPVKFEHIVHRTQPKPTPFWNVNNSAVAPLTYSKSLSLSPINWCDSKAMKNLENAARKKLLIRDGDYSEPITRREKEAYTGKTNALITQSEQHTHTLMARDLKLKSRLYLSMNDKIVTKLPSQPDKSDISNNLQRTLSPESLITNYSANCKLAKNPKVIIPPAPRITLKKIKTQLPCDFPTIPKSIDKLYKSVTKSMDMTDKSSLLPKERTCMKFMKRQQKRFKNEQQQNIDEFADMIFQSKPDNTWPPKNYHRQKK